MHGRITIDIDTKDPFHIWRMRRRLMAITGKRPRIRKTRKGCHMVVFGVDPESCLRLYCGDDRNRVRLDNSSPKRIRQVLFRKKKVTFLKHRCGGGFTGAWVTSRGTTFCTLCGREAKK